MPVFSFNIKSIFFSWVCIIFLLLNIGCKKDSETPDCPIVDEPYKSVRSYGDTANLIRVVVYNRSRIQDVENNNFEGIEGPECLGVFLSVESSTQIDGDIEYYKITNSLPDSVMKNTNYGNSQWLVNVKYLGIGIECYVDAHLVDPMPGSVVFKNEVEVVEVTHIEPYL